MIDYNFYRQLEDRNWDNIYNNTNPDEVLAGLNIISTDLPSVDQIETTNLCNMKCKMCPRSKQMTRAIVRGMRKKLFERIIDQINEYEKEKKERGLSKEDFIASPPKSLIWPGSTFDITSLRLHHFGSPLLDPLLLERLDYIVGTTGFDTQLSETIINLSVENVRNLFRRNLGRLVIALDGTTAQEFEYNRGHSIDFPKEVKKIKEIATMKDQEGHATTLHLQIINLADARNKEFEQIWNDVKGLEVLHKPFFPYPDIDHANGAATDNVFKRGCFFPFTSVTILADGRVVPCNADYNGEIILGDLNTQSLVSVWTGDPLKKFRERFVKNTLGKSHLCHRCGYYPFASQDENT